MLRGYDDKLEALNAIENWCFALIIDVVLWRNLLIFNRIVFDSSYFYRSLLVQAKDVPPCTN
jgi:hypothetical protein